MNLDSGPPRQVGAARVARKSPMDQPILLLDRHSLPRPHIRPRQARVRLEILRGRVRERFRQVPGKVCLIGSAADCDLVIGDSRFPEAYAYLLVSGTQVTIRRLGGGPPLAVCGEGVESSELFHGDVVSLGGFELRVLIDDEAPADDSDDDRDHASLPFAPSATDHLVAIDEVRVLLADIRTALGERTIAPPLFLAHLPLKASA
ncbi:MAG: FHA domain-containing protein [Pirellulaceae bacterium]|nr:FHA domain-containing protein [Pirellulaceae bacterium]